MGVAPAVEWRRDKKTSIAERLGVSRQTVNAIENQRYDPSLPLAFRIAAVFERTIEDVFEPDPNGGPP